MFFAIGTDRPHLREVAVELGVEPADALDEGRVSGQQSDEPIAGEALAKNI